MSTPEERRPTSDLLRNATDAIGDLVRQELRQGQAEMLDKARQTGKGAVLVGAAAVLGAAASGTATVLVLRILDRLMPRPAAAAVATVVLGAAAAGVGAWGLDELRRVNPVPEQTLESLREDIAVVRDES